MLLIMNAKGIARSVAPWLWVLKDGKDKSAGRCQRGYYVYNTEQ
jgi:hypothetical protein